MSDYRVWTVMAKVEEQICKMKLVSEPNELLLLFFLYVVILSELSRTYLLTSCSTTP